MNEPPKKSHEDITIDKLDAILTRIAYIVRVLEDLLKRA